MIVTKHKQYKDLEKYIQNCETFFLIGCSECATLCGTGDEEAILNLKIWLETQNKTVTGWMITKTGCQILGTKRELFKYKEALQDADCIMVLSCGSGTQSITDLFEDKLVLPVNDTLFIGNMSRFKEFEERCRACGECFLALTGVCVVTLCPKSMLNGPCGGYKDGKCEVNQQRKCAWVIAYSILEKRGFLDRFYQEILGPKDWAKSNTPRYFGKRESIIDKA